MKLEETIDLLIKISRLNTDSLYNQFAHDYNFSRGSALALYAIDEKKGTAATKIAPIMGMKNTSLSRLLKNMEEENLIIRVPNKKDKRRVKILLSDKGKERKKLVKKLVSDYNQYLIENIDKKEMENFLKTIKEITKLTDTYKKLTKINE